MQDPKEIQTIVELVRHINSKQRELSDGAIPVEARRELEDRISTERFRLEEMVLGKSPMKEAL